MTSLSDQQEEGKDLLVVIHADQMERDHQALVGAIQSGRIIAETGI